MIAIGFEDGAGPGIDPFLLALGPFIEGLIHDEEAEAVAEVEEFGGRGIVGAADGVDAGGAEEKQAALPDLLGNRGAQATGIFMEADALELHGDAVEGEAGVGVEGGGADAKGGDVGVELAVHGAGDVGDGGVDIGPFEGPERGLATVSSRVMTVVPLAGTVKGRSGSAPMAFSMLWPW